MSTVCAISTPQGRGGIAVIRVSGRDTFEICDRVWHGKPLSEVSSHSAHLGVVDDKNGRVLDQALATVFRAPNSFTGEDVVEISVHGSVYVQQSLLESLIHAGARIAEPGEFTRRAFLNGRMDLTEAEAVADLIASSSRAAHSLAVSQLQGHFSSHINSLRRELIDIAALLELELDFSEEDVTFANREQLKSLAEGVIDTVSRLASTFASGQAIREGVPVAIVGQPNAGKSSLLNALLGTDRAIVSDIPGTTRDTVEDTADINGISFRFIDTAGIRKTDDPIESLGIDRALSSLSRANIVLWLTPPECVDNEDEKIKNAMRSDATLVRIISKSDLCRERDAQGLYVSALSGEGLDDLRKLLSDTVSAGLPSDESMIVTNARHYTALTTAGHALTEMVDGIDSGLTPDLLAEHLREGINSLAEITGEITSSTVLQTIFSRFCIGK